MMATGVIMLIIGVTVSAFLCSVLVRDDARQHQSLNARSYPVYGIISPLYVQIAIVIVA
jgi:hypothetical protein